MATLLPEGKQRFANSAGAPLVGGKVYTYDAGTSNPRPTYSDAAGTVPNTNPVILDARGEATIFWSGAYKVVLKDAANVTIWTVDGASGVSGSDLAASGGAGLIGFLYGAVYAAGTVGKWLQDLATSVGSSLIGFIQGGANAVLRTLQDKARERVSILDFGGDPTGVALCNTALDRAKARCNTVYFPPGTYRIENYNLQDLRLVGEGTDGANYGVFTSIIEGSGNIFVNANNFSMQHLTIRNSAAGAAGKLISVQDIDTSIGPIENCNFLKANYHIYHSSATKTIVGAAIRSCLFREALIYSRYYANQGLFQYSEFDCYTAANKRGLFIQATSSALIAASVFEFNDEGAVYVVNTVTASDVIRGLKFENLHMEHNGNVTPSADFTINVTPSLSRVEFDNVCFYASTLAGNVDLNGSVDCRILEHQCTGISYNNTSGAKITQINAKIAGETAGVRVQSADIKVIGGQFVGNKGVSAGDSVTVRIFNVATATPVPVPTVNSASLVLVRDITTNGAAILLMTPTTVTVVSSSLTSITFTIVAGFLNGQTTGGSSFRDMFFNYITT